MSAEKPTNKSQALIQARQALAVCPKCRLPFDSIEANSHKTKPDDPNYRIYFQFVHGEDECIDFTMLYDFPAWLEKSVKATAK